MEQIISKDILLSAGFEDITYDYEKQFHKEYDGLDDYITLRRWTDDVDKNPGKVLKLDIDNCDCCSIGSADLNSIEQFNKLMEVFDSNFRL